MILIVGHFAIPFLALLRIDAKMSLPLMIPLCVWAWIMRVTARLPNMRIKRMRIGVFIVAIRVLRGRIIPLIEGFVKFLCALQIS